MSGIFRWGDWLTEALTLTEAFQGAHLVALDVDGTLMHDSGSICAEVKDAVALAVAAGHLATIASGRSLGAVLPVRAEPGLNCGHAAWKTPTAATSQRARSRTPALARKRAGWSSPASSTWKPCAWWPAAPTPSREFIAAVDAAGLQGEAHFIGLGGWLDLAEIGVLEEREKGLLRAQADMAAPNVSKASGLEKLRARRGGPAQPALT